MSKPRSRWWGFVRRMIRDYPALSRALDDLHEQSITAQCSGMPSGGSTNRSVENIALRQLPEDDQKVYDAVSKAIENIQLRPDGQSTLKLIELMYWSKHRFTVKSAALVLHVSEPTAKRRHGDFVRLAGKCYGFKN